MDIFIVRYIMKDGFLIMNWVVSMHFYVIEREIWQFVKYIFEDLNNEGSSYRAENYVHAV